ncbi:HAD-IA family hydrolase [Lyngbya confervoides]|uniref:HAD-IA family hydrolase n=1 Tax=Lyngbya confervoides BDU141951 TaxID=1574623 RepID=A0ABD4T7V5_9CYAN|nr:HAD-IA family hydrolase [Lyngbya confervoides]MCM1984585.1 HAD-IA family hydrolase [Lyngbya confervoides BDU141951]
MAQLRAIIFDVDGTLAETERVGHRVAFNQAFAERQLGWHWSEDHYAQLLHIGGGKERIRHFIAQGAAPLPQDWQGEPDLLRLHQRKNQIYQERLDQGQIQLRPGVLRLMQAARSKGVQLAIATTSSPSNAIALIQKLIGPEAPSWFTVIAAGDMVPHKKPAPDIYQFTLEALDLLPQECVVIEDSEPGVRAARACHLPVIATLHDYTRGQDFSQANWVVTHLGEADNPCTVLQGAPQTLTQITLQDCQQLLESGAIAQ